MHIIHVLTRLLRAGSEENTLATCRWQMAAGYRVTLIHGADADPWWNDHLPNGLNRIAVPEMVHTVRPMADLRALTQLRALYRELQPDVIHTHQSKAGILGRMAASSVPAARVVHGIHIVPFERVGRMRRAFYVNAERWAARNTDVFISVTRAGARAFAHAGITRPGQVRCVRSGMALAPFRQPDLPRDWRKLAGPGRPRVALMLAAFEPRKRHVAFLQSYAKVARGRNIRLLLAGKGPEEERIRTTIAALGLTNQVVLCGHRPDPGALLALADVSILTSIREGLPRVAVQSMAAGVPMVVQDLPAIGEVIQHGKNGLVLDPDDMDEMARTVTDLLETPARLRRLSAGARSTDVSAWSLEALGAQTTALYGVTDAHRSAA